jgi:hypothetical protein
LRERSVAKTGLRREEKQMTEPVPHELARLGMTQQRFEEIGRAVEELLDRTPPLKLFERDPLLPYGRLMKRLPEEGKNGVARHHAELDAREIGSLAARLGQAAYGDWDAAARALEAADWNLERAIDALEAPMRQAQDQAIDEFLHRMPEQGKAALRERYTHDMGARVIELAAAADFNAEVMLDAALMTGWDLERAVRRLANRSKTYRRLRQQNKEWLRAARAARRLTVRRAWWVPRWLVDFLLELRDAGEEKEARAGSRSSS